MMRQDPRPPIRSIQPVVSIVSIHDQPSYFAYWQSQPYSDQLAALELIRTEYHQWKYGYEPGFQRIFQSLNDNLVRYLVVGGYAVAFHGYPRYTKDLDIWIEMSQENVTRMLQALQKFGFSSEHLHGNDFLVEDQIIQLGYAPRRIDIMTSLDGVEFIDCYEKRLPIDVDGVIVNFIDLDHLRRNKKATGTYQDLADLEKLK